MLQAAGGSAAADTAARPGLDFGDGSLFKEIGNTLSDVAQQTITGAVVGLRTAAARAALQTQEGQAVASESQKASMFPIIMVVVAVLALIIGVRLLR